ncbi:MAG TPA: PadR family transcriptional regulator [Candidatus Babeliales bacterium]|nr:PadR family transcriptional regulator [Candidatus Babeliales bacterium]
MKELDKYERKLLEGWEEVFKKGQLTLWIMLALKDGPKHMSEIKEFIYRATNGSLSADDKSMYRALRRYYDTELVEYEERPGKGGPDLKVYSLSSVGSKVLDAFVKRNIVDVYFNKKVKELFR